MYFFEYFMISAFALLRMMMIIILAWMHASISQILSEKNSPTARTGNMIIHSNGNVNNILAENKIMLIKNI